MKRPRPRCPNPACVHHTDPPAGFYRKKGYRRAKHNHQPVPRYQCKACGKYFCGTQTLPSQGHHRPELNHQVLALAVSGVSLRRMAMVLGCSRRTIDRKVLHLAQQAQKCHTKHLQSLETAYVMFDELETFIHARWAQVSVPVVVRVKTGEVLAFGVAKKPSTMRRGIEGNRWVVNERPKVVPAVLASVAGVLKPGATLATDGESSYSKWIGRALPSAQHKATVGVKGPGYDPLFAINVAFAKMRNDLARLGRKTWTTTKTIKGLEDHLWLWVAWTNGYRLR